MSRSYKKSPVLTDGKRKTTKESKRFANKTVRHYKKGISNGKAYRKLFCSYDIHDWVSYWSWHQAKKEYESGELVYLQDKYPTLNKFYQYWKKYQKRK